MSKQELGAAFKSLNVKEPYNLKHTKPAFVRPEPILDTLVSTATEVPVQTMVTPDTQVALPTKASTQTPVVTDTTVTTPTKVTAVTQATTATLVTEETLVNAETKISPETQVTRDTAVTTHTQVSTATMVPTVTNVVSSTPSVQKSAVQFEAKALAGLEKGYTRIPNSILMAMAAGELIRSEMMIVLLIARFTFSYDRKTAPLSKAVFERQTRLSGPAVLEALDSLLTKGLIVKEKGDQNRPNYFGLVATLTGEANLVKKVECMAISSANAAMDTLVTVATQVPTLTPVAVPTGTLVTTATHFKNNINIKKSISSSSVNIIENHAREVTDYLSAIKAPRKRTSELDALGELSKSYSQEQIASALEYILKHGSLHDKVPCHSPIKYLCSAMDQVLKIVETAVESKRAKEVREAQILAQKQIHEELGKADERLARERENAFIKTFPSEDLQRRAIAELLPDESKLLPMRIQRALAINRWGDANFKNLLSNTTKRES